MPIRSACANPETIQDAIVAAEDRFWDGLELMILGRLWGGVYLMGYSSEMYLKTASCMLEGATTPSDILCAFFAPSRNWTSTHPESYHSIRYWTEVLCTKRPRFRSPFNRDFENALRTHSSVIYNSWCAGMRYRRAVVSLNEATAVHESSTWLMNNFNRLWS